MDTPLLQDEWTMWNRGRLRYLTRPHYQRLQYDFIDSCDMLTIVLVAHRRKGKTFNLALKCIERCISRDNQIVKYGAPTYRDATRIVRRQVNKILLDCPPSMRPKYTGGNIWKFPNGSELEVVGIDHNGGDSLRGDALDLCVLDEVGFVKHTSLKYLVSDVLLFQFAGREDAHLILSSTPPKSADHDFVQHFIPKAINQNAYLCLPLEDENGRCLNKDWDEEDTKLLLEDLDLPTLEQARKTASWQREALCRLDIGDEEFLIVPEFHKRVVQEQEVPEWYFPVVGMDLGYRDPSAAVYGYPDFEQNKLIIQDEIWCQGQNTGELHNLLASKEQELWATTCKRYREVQRWGDLTLQQRMDLETLYKYHILQTEKYDVEEAVGSMRTAIQEGKILINPRCKHLIYQLENHCRTDNKKDWERTERGGHFDSGMALVYLWRMAKHLLDVNPGPGYSRVQTLREIIQPQEDWYEEYDG